jgi:hypothetical protein
MVLLSAGQERALARQRKHAERAGELERCLVDTFPSVYAVAHGSLFVTCGSVGAALQLSILMQSQSASANYEMGQGVWAGFLCILIGLSTLILGKSW